MAGSHRNGSWIPLCLLTALLVVMPVYPAAAGTYTARSAEASIPGYGTARSQPQYQGSPITPAPPGSLPEKPADPVNTSPGGPVSPQQQLPAYSFNGSSHGTARSSGGAYSRFPAAPPAKPVSPPEQPNPPVIPEKPVDPPPPVTPDAPPAGEETATASLNQQERQLLELVNGERALRGLLPLQPDAQLTYLARLKSQDMADLNYFAHESPGYGSSGDMLRSAGIAFGLAAENIGVGGSIKVIFNAFMNSSGHRNKIVDPRYTRTGIGVVYKPGRGYLVTQLFLMPR